MLQKREFPSQNISTISGFDFSAMAKYDPVPQLLFQIKKKCTWLVLIEMHLLCEKYMLYA